MSKNNTFNFGYSRGQLIPAHQHVNGGGWVADTAKVDDTAYVGPNAIVYQNARVHDYARICDNAEVFANAKVYENAEICVGARVFGNAKVYGNAKIDYRSRVEGNAEVYGNAKINGFARVFGNAKVYGNAKVIGFAWVYGNAEVYGNTIIKRYNKIGGKMKSRFYLWKPGTTATIKDYKEKLDYFSSAIYHENGEKSGHIIQKKRKWSEGDKANSHISFWKNYEIKGYELSSVFVTEPLDN